jgi:predicted DCC family thiol-disulfide oxidoreductase YuxK
MNSETDKIAKRGTQNPPIIFFDGVCGMCNRFVDLILRIDNKGVFRFAPIQGETAKRLLPPLAETPQEWSMFYLDERGVYKESDAFLEVYRHLGGAWWFLSLLRLVPRGIRDFVYRTVARNRYRWFGQRDVCRIPSPEEKCRFLS